ncbi:alpha/beta fold hydrolase [Kribbella catacumbae]|uniref:alpha/beta fold hydrolase n=1 Tax=Kribbella catacumbae TaxID=460086 RepID=UPI00036A6114|nr:alpha/beta hydrolase [Kribbella catacumbae]
MPEVTLTRGDVQLRGTATGNGPTVLLLHAGGEDRSVWTPIAAILTKHQLRTLAFDLRGHGASTGQANTLQPIADDVTAMIHNEPPPVIVVGASLGGLATIAALANPPTTQAVAGLILVDVVPNPDPARVRTWLDDRGLRDHRTDLVEDILNHSHELLTTATKLDLPVLLVRGGPTSPLTDAEVHRFHALIPTLTITQIPTAGHLIAHDAPDQLAHIITNQASAWLTEHST